jgi:hypothetical protein
MPSIFLDYAVPTRCQAHTLSDATVMPAQTIGISLVVTVAGVVPLQMHSDPASVLVDLGAGTHFIPGNWKLALSTGLTATVTNSKVIVYIANPAASNY